MSAFRFSFRGNNQQKQILVATHPADILLRTDAKVCLCGDLDRLPQYHDKYTSLEEADFVVVLGEKGNDIPEMLLHLGKDLCPNGDPILVCDTGEERKEWDINELVLKMHKLTPPAERNILWQRYFHALAQATPDAQEIFMRMAENNGLIERSFKTVKQVKTNHFNPITGHVIDWTSKARSHNFVGYIK